MKMSLQFFVLTMPLRNFLLISFSLNVTEFEFLEFKLHLMWTMEIKPLVDMTELQNIRTSAAISSGNCAGYSITGLLNSLSANSGAGDPLVSTSLLSTGGHLPASTTAPSASTALITPFSSPPKFSKPLQPKLYSASLILWDLISNMNQQPIPFCIVTGHTWWMKLVFDSQPSVLGKSFQEHTGLK